MQKDIFKDESVKLLVSALAGIESEQECRMLLEDLLSTKEILDISQRVEVAKMLSEGHVYSKIAEKTGASTATISRVNRSYTYGAGGYTRMLKRFQKKKTEEE
ncbi:MAG: TrpR YerC/YecD [Clostridia bacterium]|nr:TrpR YerC/YecD [Clostridia bacterium]